MIFVLIIFAFIFLVIVKPVLAGDCGGYASCQVDTAKLRSVLSVKMDEPDLEIEDVLCDKGVHIIGIDTHRADGAFLFYEKDPLTTDYSQLWSGAIAEHEVAIVRKRVAAINPSVSNELVSCFVEHALKRQGLYNDL